MLSSRSFIVFCFTFRSLVHLEFILDQMNLAMAVDTQTDTWDRLHRISTHTQVHMKQGKSEQGQ